MDAGPLIARMNPRLAFTALSPGVAMAARRPTHALRADA